MRRNLSLSLLPLVVAVFILACGGDDDSNPATQQAGPGGSEQQQGVNGAANSAAQTLNGWLPALVQQVGPSVVSVILDQGEGSGVIWDERHIVTNNHVVEAGGRITIVLLSGERIPATLLATDPLTDLAVLRVEDGVDLPEAAKFDEELPKVGELALAIGNPLGFESSVTFGIVSGQHRSIPSGGSTPALVDLVQTDAAISPGNSGGALVGADGRLIGINVAYIPPQAGSVSLGFAIPSATVVNVVKQLLQNGRAEHAFLGIEPRPLEPSIAKQLGLSVSEGVFVFGVSQGGAASRAGVEPGDVIVKMDGREISSIEDLYTALRRTSPGDRVDIVVVRNGDERTMQVTLDDRPT